MMTFFSIDISSITSPPKRSKLSDVYSMMRVSDTPTWLRRYSSLSPGVFPSILLLIIRLSSGSPSPFTTSPLAFMWALPSIIRPPCVTRLMFLPRIFSLPGNRFEKSFTSLFDSHLTSMEPGSVSPLASRALFMESVGRSFNVSAV